MTDESEVEIPPAEAETVVERINKSYMKPLYDPSGHQHEFVPDFSDETDHYLAYHCIHCPLGRLMRKT